MGTQFGLLYPKFTSVLALVMSDTASSSAEEDGTHTYHSQFCKYLTPVRTGVGLLTTLGKDLNIEWYRTTSVSIANLYQHCLLLLGERLLDTVVNDKVLICLLMIGTELKFTDWLTVYHNHLSGLVVIDWLDSIDQIIPIWNIFGFHWKMKCECFLSVTNFSFRFSQLPFETYDYHCKLCKILKSRRDDSEQVEGVCCRVFALILNFDGVRRGFLYSLFAIFCFYPNLTGSSIAPGVLLTITAVLYLLKSVQFKKVVVAQESESNVQSVGRTVA
uniref:Pecanex-like protein n=1 Tax=Elaeophora elaphi TaxID=1147741 RepID=A0A0R3RPI6_9BILA